MNYLILLLNTPQKPPGRTFDTQATQRDMPPIYTTSLAIAAKVCVLFCLMFAFTLNKGLAQCDLPVITYSIPLATAQNGNVIGSYPLSGECCSPQPGNNSCLIFDIALNNQFGAVAMCFGTPCSIQGYVLPDAGSACPLGAGIDLCQDQICIPPNATSIEVLVCKPGAADNPIDVSILGIAPIDLEVEDITDGCTTTFNVTGAVSLTCSGGNAPPTSTPLPVS